MAQKKAGEGIQFGNYSDNQRRRQKKQSLSQKCPQKAKNILVHPIYKADTLKSYDLIARECIDIYTRISQVHAKRNIWKSNLLCSMLQFKHEADYYSKMP